MCPSGHYIVIFAKFPGSEKEEESNAKYIHLFCRFYFFFAFRMTSLIFTKQRMDALDLKPVEMAIGIRKRENNLNGYAHEVSGWRERNDGEKIVRVRQPSTRKTVFHMQI